MVHLYKNNGMNIVLDVESGAVHVVDGISYDMIGLLSDAGIGARDDEAEKKRDDIFAKMKSDHPSISDDELIEVYDEIMELVDSGDLFTEDTYRDRVIDYTKRPTVVKALCLHIAHDCNLSCKYCFAEEGLYHGKKAELMSYEVGKQALDFLVEASGSRHNLEVDFFGGEPLLNWQVVKDLVAYGRSIEAEHDKHFRFTLTTNGVLLTDEVMEFVNREMDNVVLSIDGRKEVHDYMRPFQRGDGSYDIIVPKFKKLADSRDQDRYYVRGTYTRYNKDFSEDVLHLAELGFKQISVEPVVAPEDEQYALREEDLPELFDQYDRLAAEMIERAGSDREFNFFHFMIDLEGGPCVYKRLSGCGSGTEYLSVTPDGSLFPCHQFVGNEGMQVGDVWHGVTNTDLVTEFKGCNVYSRPKCSDCFAKYYCSGGCAANAYHFTGDIRGNYEVGCELQKKRVECAIAIKAATVD